MQESCQIYYSPSNDVINVTKNDKRFSCFAFQGINNGIYKTKFHRGKYRVELWGASAGNTVGREYSYPGGKGGYTRGDIELRQETFFTFYVGTKGGNTVAGSSTVGTAGFNGGSKGGYDNSNYDNPTAGSGGSTDMRIQKSDVTDATVYDRIMVAGAGGSSGAWTFGGLGGHGGGVKGTPGLIFPGHALQYVNGGNQTHGYKILQGEKGLDAAAAGGSGGGGYYGGFGGVMGNTYSTSGGGGGSSFISGHIGCFAMDSNGKSLKTSIHPSGYFFTNTVTIEGNNYIPSTSDIDEFEEFGHVGDGFVRITVLSQIYVCSKPITNFNCLQMLFILEFIFISE